MKIRFSLSFLICVFALSANAQVPKEISLPELKLLYNELYLTSAIDSFNWKNKGACDPGTIPAEVYVKAEKRINFFRMMNRLPQIKITNDKKEETQAAAFICMKNNSLNHTPPTSWKCYSKKAADGAAHSCLGMSNFTYWKSTSFIDGWIADEGNSNYFVGHRRWLLSSRATKFSYGATSNTEALYCGLDQRNDTLKNEFIAYPWSGHVPYELIFCKWSFAIPQIHQSDLSKAKVTVKGKKGNLYQVDLQKQVEGFPDNTIVWKVESLVSTEEEKKDKNQLKEKGLIGEELTVKIENVIVNKKTRTYEYKVKITELQ
jgi:hypothetical protein